MRLPHFLPTSLASLPTTLLALSMVPSAQAPIDLTTWSAESYDAVSGFGAGIWTVAADGESVHQSVNGQPTLFYSPFDAFNTQAEGEIVCGGGDDDYWGFVLGFDPGDTNNPNADYLLVDWKAGTQGFNFGAPSCTGGSTADRGLAVSRVRGIPSADEFWGHENLDTAPCSGPTDSVVELARGVTLGNVGWSANQTYSFRFEFTAAYLRVYVDGLLELDVTGLFSNGRIGFYNFSQADVTYSAYTVNCEASWTNLGAGFPGTLGVPQFGLSGLPSFGNTINVDLVSSNPAPSAAIIVYGSTPAFIPTTLGGSLWVSPEGVAIESLGVGTTSVPLTIGVSPSLCGSAVYAQFVQTDPGATFGFSFSPSLEILYGF